MKLSPFAIYFAGVGTVVTALAVGFGSAVFLTSTPDAKEAAVASAVARGSDAKLTKIEKFQAAKRDDGRANESTNVSASDSASTLLAATITVPVDVKPAAPAAAQPEKAVAADAKQEPEAKRQQAAATPQDGVQGTAAFEGADNAVEIKPSKKPIAEAAKPERKRRVAQRKTRDVVVQSRRGADVEDAADSSDESVVVYRRAPGGDYRAVEGASRADDGRRVIVRTYEARSRGFDGLFDTEED